MGLVGIGKNELCVGGKIPTLGEGIRSSGLFTTRVCAQAQGAGTVLRVCRRGWDGMPALPLGLLSIMNSIIKSRMRDSRTYSRGTLTRKITFQPVPQTGCGLAVRSMGMMSSTTSPESTTDRRTRAVGCRRTRAWIPCAVPATRHRPPTGPDLVTFVCVQNCTCYNNLRRNSTSRSVISRKSKRQ